MEFNNIKYKNVEGYNLKEILIKPSVKDCILECPSANIENILSQNADIKNINTSSIKIDNTELTSGNEHLNIKKLNITDELVINSSYFGKINLNCIIEKGSHTKFFTIPFKSNDNTTIIGQLNSISDDKPNIIISYCKITQTGLNTIIKLGIINVGKTPQKLDIFSYILFNAKNGNLIGF